MAKPRQPRSARHCKTLPVAFIRSILSYDPRTGILRWNLRNDVNSRWNKLFAGKRAGCKTSNGSICVTINDSFFLAHRVIWAIVTGEWPPNEVDHKNGNPSNNRWTNLRLATSQQNIWNRKKLRNNKTGFKWVRWVPDRKKWRAHCNGRHIGYFSDPRKAHEAARKIAVQTHKEFAKFK